MTALFLPGLLGKGLVFVVLVVVGLVVLTLFIGFVAGFTTFRRSLRWCATCGAGLRCIECTSRRAVP